jgi:hypothetical protein
MAFASMSVEIKSPPGNGPYCFRTHGQDLPFGLTNEANKPGYGELRIFDSAEATTKRLEGQTNQGCMGEVRVMQ